MKTASKSSTHKPYHSPTIIVVAATAAFTLILLMVNILFSSTLPGTEASTTGTIYPIADAYVKSSQTTNNYGTSTDLDVKNDPANTKISYLTFDISPYSGKTILSAVLRIKTRDISYAGSAEAQNIWNVSDTSWSETQITYAVRPTISNIQLGQISNTVPSTSYDIPLNLSTFRSLMKTNPTRISMAFIGSPNSNGIYFYSKEGTVKPQLIITYDNVTPTPTKTPTPTAATTIAPTATKTPTPTPTGAACTITMTTSPSIQANSTSSVTSMLSPKTGYSATSVSYVIDTQTPASVVLTGAPYVSTNAPYNMTLTAGSVGGTARITARGIVTSSTGAQVFCDAVPITVTISAATNTPTPTPTAVGGGFGGLTLGQVVSGTIYITFYSDAAVTDYVRFYIDTIFINEEHDYPYSLNGDTNGVLNGYDTRQLTNGQHTLKADIYFKDGSIQTYSVIFNVNNQTQPTATAIPTTTPTKTPTPTPVTVSIIPTATPTKTPTPTQATVSIAPSATTVPCAMKSQGDANCDNKVDMIDYEIWRQEFAGLVTTHNADFNSNGQTELIDYETWRQGFVAGLLP